MEYNDQELKNLIDLYALQNSGITVPSCSEGPTRVVKYEEVSCTFEKVCTAEAELTEDLECNDGTTEASSGSTVTYTTRTHLPCGTQCCKIEYDVCTKSYTIGTVAQNDRIISNYTKSAITPCTSPPPGTTAGDCEGCN